MLNDRLNLIEACEKAASIVVQTQEMDRLYRRAVQSLGAGELRMGILTVATDAIQEKDLSDEVFLDDESMLSFLCGVWIQFLLTEFGGIEKEKLRALAQKVFMNIHGDRWLH